MSRLTGSEARGLMEAYNAVYAPKKLTEEQVWEEVEYWVNSLLEEGYDLSDYTWEEMYEAYIEEDSFKWNPNKNVIASKDGKLGIMDKGDPTSWREPTDQEKGEIPLSSTRAFEKSPAGQAFIKQRDARSTTPTLQPKPERPTDTSKAYSTPAPSGGYGGTAGASKPTTAFSPTSTPTDTSKAYSTPAPSGGYGGTAGASKPTTAFSPTSTADAAKSSAMDQFAKANPKLAEVERLRNQQRAAGKSPFDVEFRTKVINPVMYNSNKSIPNSGRSVEDSKKMFPDTPKPAPTQTSTATPTPSLGQKASGLSLGSSQFKPTTPDAKPTTPAATPATPTPAAAAPATAAKKPVDIRNRNPMARGGFDPRFDKQSFDLFDVIKGHLLDEGYADTEQAALAIMANMSEEWKQSIVEAVDDTHPGHPEYKGQSQDPLSRLNRTIGRGLRFVTGQRTAEVRAKQGGVPGNVFVKQSGPFSTKNVPVPGSFMSDTELIRRGLGTKPMGPIGE